jgi:Flp pilus assembly protein TadB
MVAPAPTVMFPGSGKKKRRTKAAPKPRAEEPGLENFYLGGGVFLAILAALAVALGGAWVTVALIVLWIVGIAVAIRSVTRIRADRRKKAESTRSRRDAERHKP